MKHKIKPLGYFDKLRKIPSVKWTKDGFPYVSVDKKNTINRMFEARTFSARFAKKHSGDSQQDFEDWLNK